MCTLLLRSKLRTVAKFRRIFQMFANCPYLREDEMLARSGHSMSCTDCRPQDGMTSPRASSGTPVLIVGTGCPPQTVEIE